MHLSDQSPIVASDPISPTPHNNENNNNVTNITTTTKTPTRSPHYYQPPPQYPYQHHPINSTTSSAINRLPQYHTSYHIKQRHSLIHQCNHRHHILQEHHR